MKKRDKEEATRRMVKKKEKSNFINLTIFTFIINNQTYEDFVKLCKYFCLPSTNCQQPQLNLVCRVIKNLSINEL